mmetsp:Transcript_11151/g.31077  ORF Transcript_11151/g.31077 Transcript_11151/m.31077 type:complete len:266 (-) Transcript_11151:771-1568(-)
MHLPRRGHHLRPAGCPQGRQVFRGGRRGQDPGALLQEGALVLQGAGGSQVGQAGRPLLALLPPDLGQGHGVHALRGQDRQPDDGRPQFWGRRLGQAGVLAIPAAAPAAGGGATAPRRRAGRRPRPEKEPREGARRVPREGRFRGGLQALLQHPRPALADQRGRPVAHHRPGPRPGPAHAEALPRPVHPGHHRADPPLRGVHPHAEEGAVPGEQQRFRAGHRLGEEQVRRGVLGLHEPHGRGLQRQGGRLANGGQPVGRLHGGPVG